VSLPTSLEQKRGAYLKDLENASRSILRQLCAIPEVEKVILFGSYAAGRRDLFTDLDLLVVMASEKDIVTRTAELYQQVHSDVDLDLFVFTPEEIERQKGSSFLRSALRTGKVLYEKRST
jgi:predicted nucleotidyltransferase